MNENNGFDTQQGFNNFPQSKYRLILKREKNFVASLVAFKVFIDNVEVGKIKNGETLTLEVTPGEHKIAINDNPTTINITGDTTADVVVFGSNTFGITNINGQGQGSIDNSSVIKKAEKQTNGVLYGCLIAFGISIVMLFTIHYVLSVWIYMVLLGCGVVNVLGLKNIKNIDPAKHKSLLIKNVIGMILAIILIILTSIITA